MSPAVHDVEGDERDEKPRPHEVPGEPRAISTESRLDVAEAISFEDAVRRLDPMEAPWTAEGTVRSVV